MQLANREDPNQQIEYATEDLHHLIHSLKLFRLPKNLVGSPINLAEPLPGGFDSSGFINYVFAQVGKPLERTHASMWGNNGHSR